MTMTVPAPTPSPYDIIDIPSMEGALAFAEEVLAAATPIAVGVVAPAAIIAGGVVVTNQLLKWKAWDHFWLAAGAQLNNVWHAAGSFLFGGGGAADLHVVSSLIQLAMHMTLRTSRQLIGSAVSKAESLSVALHHSIVNVATHVNGLAASLAAHYAAAVHYAQSVALRAERYADARIHTATGVLAALTAHEVNALRAELLRDVINPLHSEVIALGQIVRPITVDVQHVKDILGHNVVPNLAKALATGTAAFTLAHLATTFVQECGEPMCNSIGPKTNWGKLFERFGPAGLLAILAAIEAVDPKAAEDAAQHFAQTVGPVLERWAEAWLGLIPGDTGALAGEVGQNVGTITL